MDPYSSSHLCKPRDRFLYLFAADHHQIGKFIDDDDDERQRPMRFASFLVELLRLVPTLDLGVVAVDVSNAPTR